MGRLGLALLFSLVIMLAACSKQNPVVKLIASGKTLPFHFSAIAFKREESPYFSYLANKVTNQKDDKEMWRFYGLKRPIAKANFEKKDLYFIGLQESSTCPHGLAAEKTAWIAKR